MQSVKVSNRYAKALLEFSVENNQVEKVFEEMTSVVKIFRENTELRSLFRSPILKSEVKKNILNDIFLEKSEVLAKFLELLTKSKRLPDLYDIAKTFLIQYNQYKENQTAIVTTAQPISEELKTKFLTKIEELTGRKNISLKNKVDESLIGGFILRIGDLQYNASVLNKFNNLQREFSEKIAI